jgi:rhodanese-related sulfurtransferase
VFAFIGGIPEWRKFNYPMEVDKSWQAIGVKKLSPTQFHEHIDKPTYFILDVRPLNFKRDTSFIAGSWHCPLVLLHERYQTLPKDRKILITDWAMKQSPTAAKYLIRKGYSVEGVLKGGLERWKAESFPIEERDPTKTADMGMLLEQTDCYGSLS